MKRRIDWRQLPLGIEAPQAERALAKTEERQAPPAPGLRRWPFLGDRVVVAVGIREGVSGKVIDVNRYGTSPRFVVLRMDDDSPPMTVYKLAHMRREG